MDTRKPDSDKNECCRQRELAVFWAAVALDVARLGGTFQEAARRAHEAYHRANPLQG